MKLFSFVLFFETESHSVAQDRKSTRLNSSHVRISYAVFCWKKKSRSIAGGPPAAQDGRWARGARAIAPLPGRAPLRSPRVGDARAGRRGLPPLSQRSTPHLQ